MNLILHSANRRLVTAQDKKMMEQREDYVRMQNNILANRIINEGIDEFSFSDDFTEDSDMVSELQLMAAGIEGRIILLSSNFKVVSDTYERNLDQYIITEDTLRAMRGESVASKKVGDSYVQVTTGIYDKESAQSRGVIITLASLQEKTGTLAYIGRHRVVINGLFLLISIVLGVLLTMYMRHCFRDILTQMNVIAEGHQENRLSEEGFKEFYQMAVSFNKITDRFKELENSRQEFVSNVSHELKTPITSMKILADSLLMQDDVPVEIYEEFMGDIVHEIDRENQIITDLLDLVRMDKASSDLNISPANINELLEQLLKRITPIAEKQDITIHLETMRQVTAEVDVGKLSLACNNIIENAVKYNNPGGHVNVYLNADHKFFYIRVRDDGVGIPEDCQDRIFERFYRVDKARSRETGGTGLGLAISRKVVLLHKGSIRVHSKEGEGTTFIIRIPLNYIG
ncbi:MAG: two-component sensor histidine kinase [Eubacterium sp.]|nr:two-component sensor histidine kinase [Eubacterium sp.]